MKIALAQIHSLSGKIYQNLEKHLTFIDRAAQLNADLICFPELSITNYGLHFDEHSIPTIESGIFSPFQEISNQQGITICVGAPTRSSRGIHISSLIFQPNASVEIYSKRLLHSDEQPYFIPGDEQSILIVQGRKIAIAICFEALQREHFLNAREHGAEVYLASVAKPQTGIEKAHRHFADISREFRIPILMANCIGSCDDFQSVGQSAIWNEFGEIVDSLGNKDEGLLIYTIDSQEAIDPLKFESND